MLDHISTYITKYFPYVILASATILSIFSVGQYNIPICSFISPFLFLHFIHSSPFSKRNTLLLVLLSFIISSIIKYIGYSNLNFLLDMLMGLVNSISLVLPYILEPIINPLIGNSVFLFPLLETVTEIIFSLNPYLANFNILAYALSGNKFLMQICSLFGMFFLSFLIALFASVLEFSIDHFSKTQKIHKYLFNYLILFSAVFIYGGLRLIINPINNKTTKKRKIVSCLGVSHGEYPEKNFYPLDYLAGYIRERAEKSKAINADILIFSELAFIIDKSNYDGFQNLVKEIAKENNITILLSLDMKTDEDKQNLHLIINRMGETYYQYIKQHPVPFVEMGYKRGSDELKSFKERDVKYTSIICYDIDFVFFVNKIGRMGVDVLLVPSWDWKSVATFQFEKTRFRAVENGFNIIKNTFNGIVLSCDFLGNVNSFYDSAAEKDFFTVSDVNAKRRWTLYGNIGWLINALYVLGFIIVIWLGRRKINLEGNGGGIKGEEIEKIEKIDKIDKIDVLIDLKDKEEVESVEIEDNETK